MYQVRRGLGDFTATVNGKSITVDSNGNWVPGFWCLNFGSALGIASCATPTAAEISQVVGMSDIGPNVSASAAAAVVADQNAAAAVDCAANPQLCAAAASGEPALSAVGTVVAPIGNLASGILQTASDIGNALKCGLFQTAQEQDDGSYVCATNWVLWGGIALVGLFAVVAMGGGSARRYGR